MFALKSRLLRAFSLADGFDLDRTRVVAAQDFRTLAGREGRATFLGGGSAIGAGGAGVHSVLKIPVDPKGTTRRVWLLATSVQASLAITTTDITGTFTSLGAISQFRNDGVTVPQSGNDIATANLPNTQMVTLSLAALMNGDSDFLGYLFDLLPNERLYVFHATANTALTVQIGYSEIFP